MFVVTTNIEKIHLNVISLKSYLEREGRYNIEMFARKFFDLLKHIIDFKAKTQKIYEKMSLKFLSRHSETK